MATCLLQPTAMALKVDVIYGPAVAMSGLRPDPGREAAGKLMTQWLSKLHKA